MIWATPALIVTLLLVFAAARQLLERRYPANDAPLIDTVDALLPQTQCAQCGYPGCRPYAEALVLEAAPIDLCPPGGPALHTALAELFSDAQPTQPPVSPSPLRAVIDEAACIGCALCLPPCPVDAIVGAQGQMHTVIEAECTGCELCVPACPVDCIDLVHLPVVPGINAPAISADERPCIGCGACNPVCPVDLRAQDLLALVAQDPASGQDAGVERCIECGLCDRACPSGIALATRFAAAKSTLAAQRHAAAERDRLRARFDAHQARLEAAAQSAEARRAARLAERADRARQWQ